MTVGDDRRRSVGRWTRRVAAALAVALVTALTTLAVPTMACGCGAYIAGGARVEAETSLIRMNGGRETIVMALGVQGTLPDAAWVMPVPGTAQVSLADSELFDVLTDLTAPRVVYVDQWLPSLDFGFGRTGAGDGAPGVQVLEVTTLGPFEVARLTGDDPQAVASWLEGAGYELQPDVAQRLSHYTSRGWEIVAARLTAAAGAALGGGTLTPLQLEFDSDSIVYPMLLSQGAEVSQSIRLFVLAEHRVRVQQAPVDGLTDGLRFAGRLEPAAGGDLLADYLTDGTTFLTGFEQVISDPAAITDDYLLTMDDTDEPYQSVVYIDRDRSAITVIALLVALVAGAVTLIVAVTSGRRRPRAGSHSRNRRSARWMARRSSRDQSGCAAA